MVSLPQLHAPPPGEGCGPCTACCDVMGVADLGKTYYARCAHLGAGCGIYADRPRQCQDFRCVWHLGLLGPRADRRPDACGVIFSLDLQDGRWYLAMYEAKPGAADTDAAQ